MKYALCDNCEHRLYANQTAFKFSVYIFCSSKCMQRYVIMTAKKEGVELFECFYDEDNETDWATGTELTDGQDKWGDGDAE